MNKREITPEITSEQLFKLAKTAVDYANRDDEFIVRDLFREIEWRHIPEKIRMKAGELFGNYAESEEGSVKIIRLQGKDAKTEKWQQRNRKL